VNQLPGLLGCPRLTFWRNDDVIFWKSAQPVFSIASREDKIHLPRGINRINALLCVC
jgi:hypothetical protein